MRRKQKETFTILATTPEIKKVLGGPVAFSPTEPLIAETGDLEKEDIVRITNYETKAVVGKIAIDVCHLSFSPDGKHLLAMGYGKCFLCSEPWGVSRTYTILGEHCAWLDNRTVLFAGSISWEEFGIAVLDIVDGSYNIVYQGTRQEWSQQDTGSDNSLDSVYCSPSGLVAFAVGYGRYIALYQLDKHKLSIQESRLFPARYNGNGLEVLVSEYGETILCCSKYSSHWVGLFSKRGQLLDELNASTETASYKCGIICLRTHASRSYGSEIHIYQVRDGKFQKWCSLSGRGKRGCDLSKRGDTIILAVEQEKETAIYELTDFDILQLSSEEPEKRYAAVHSLGQRRFLCAARELIPYLWDDVESVQRAAIEALVAIGDPVALPQLIRAIGYKDSAHLRGSLEPALQRFPPHQLVPAILDCITRPGDAYRLGAARFLEHAVFVEALEELCGAVHDANSEIRIAAAGALGKRANIRACVALMAHLNDDDDRVRFIVQQALITILKSAGLLSTDVNHHLVIPMDVAAYAQSVVSTGRMTEFNNFGNLPVGDFLVALASACVQSDLPLPQILNAIGALTIAYENSPERLSVSIALTMALVCADAMRGVKRWQEAAGIYQNAVTLALRAQAPQVEWRAWHSVGKCFEILGDDHTALSAFRNAMDVIDRLWFALLEEDKLRNFFQDKALLYDQAALCCLRLGYKALALECGEKAKTRYLGDLIARRQLDPQVTLAQEVDEFWRNLDGLRTVSASAGSPQTASEDQVEIVGVEWGLVESGTRVVKPRHRAAFEDAYQNAKTNNGVIMLDILQQTWQLVAYISGIEDEIFQECLEKMYQAISPLHEAIKTKTLPVPVSEREQIVQQFEEAAHELSLAGRGDQNAPFWLFAEYGRSWQEWIEDTCLATELNDMTLFIEAVVEALNLVLHHEAILGTAVNEFVEEEQEGSIFVTLSHTQGASLLSRGTTLVESALERLTRTQWRNISRLARGEISTYHDIANSLKENQHVAYLQFSVTEHGTVIYVIYGHEAEGDQTRVLPDLHGEEDLQVFTCTEVTLSSLRQRLVTDKEAWFVQYNLRHQPNGFKSWQAAMDQTLNWLYSCLWTPVDTYLKARGIKRLWIIPNRALQLMPLSALYRIGPEGQRGYLIDDYDVGYAPSATLWQICKERAKGRSPQKSLTAILNPTGDLPFAAIEVDQVVNYFSTSHSQVLRGGEAKYEVLKTILPGSLLHFAGHGSYSWNDPLTSHLVFAEDKILTLADLFSEQISFPQTALVILSACESSVSNPEDLADEYLGLASGFLFAGTPAIISTLWAVDDISTALLMKHFYRRYIKDNMSPTQALCLAQRWLFKKVDRPTVIREINSLSSKLESQRAQVPRWSDAAQSIDRQLSFLQKRLDALIREEALDPGGKPFAHPYYWAAFMISGADTENRR